MSNQNLFAALRAAFPADLDRIAVETADAGSPTLRYSWRDLDRATAMMANLLASLELPEGSSAAAYMSDGSTMEEIFVVSCKDKTDASAVKIAMQELLDSQTQEAGRYQPEEAERLNNAVFATYGTCVVLCVTSDTDTANAVIKEYVG